MGFFISNQKCINYVPVGRMLRPIICQNFGNLGPEYMIYEQDTSRKHFLRRHLSRVVLVKKSSRSFCRDAQRRDKTLRVDFRDQTLETLVTEKVFEACVLFIKHVLTVLKQVEKRLDQ